MEMKTIDNFDPITRAFPFLDGIHRVGLTVTKEGVTFRLQRSPIGEVGVNGCQIDDVISFARMTLEEAELWLGRRRINRERRGVEGTSTP